MLSPEMEDSSMEEQMQDPPENQSHADTESVAMEGETNANSPNDEKAALAQADKRKVGKNKQSQPGPQGQRHLHPVPPKEEGNQPSTSESVNKNQPPDNPTAILTPEKDAPAAAGDNPSPSRPPQNPGAGVPSSPKHLRGAQAFALKGNKNIHARTVIQTVNNNYSPMQEERRSEENVSLLDISTTLPSRELNVPGGNAYSAKIYVQHLREQHLLMISSVDQRVALGAAYSLIDEMGIDGEERRLLNFDRNPLGQSNLSMHLFTQRVLDDNENLTAIVVDAFNIQAVNFLDWLVSTTVISAMDLRKQLRENRLLMLCLVDESYVEGRFGDGKGFTTSTVWRVPFLPPLLKCHFQDRYAELEREIRAQQIVGKWRKSDLDLCIEIRPYLDNQELPRELEFRARAETATDRPEAPPFKGSQPLEDTLLYVATYFLDLAPHEFDQMVTCLIGDKTTTVTVKSSKQNKDGETETVETEAEKRLIDFWNAEPDKYLQACQLEAVSGKDATVVIDFTDATWREELKARLERKHSLYLMRQFQAIQKEQLLFNSTPRIVANIMRLSIDMAITYPDSFGKDWLFRITREGGTNGAKVAEVSPTDNSATLDSNRAPSIKVHERIPQLLRQMLERPQLVETVDGFLKELMSAGAHDSVIYIVKGLQFAPRFDEFLWIKRLLDEGDEQVRHRTYYHLYSYTKKIGIHPLLRRLDAWVPDDERLPETYSNSTMHALRLLIEYCSETTQSFDHRYYGLAQPLHPLLSFVDHSSARENLARLVKLLFHPGTQIIFAGLEIALEEPDFESYVIPFVCELLVEWMFVLQGLGPASSMNPENAASTQAAELQNERRSETGSGIDAATVRDTLIEEIVRVTNPVQRNEMLTYWEQLRDFMAFILTLRQNSAYWIEPLDYREQVEIRWKRELVKELIKHFRGTIRNCAAKPTKRCSS
jgi:hypothetical protein